MTTKKKRGRTKNFTKKEKQMLISLITPYKNIVEIRKVNILPMFLM